MKSIYIASRTVHAQKWLALRSGGENIISTWINEAGVGATPDFADLARRCVSEPQQADYTILYSETEDYLKFALVEVGAALAAGKTVIVVGEGPSISSTMLYHANVFLAGSIEGALRHVHHNTPS